MYNIDDLTNNLSENIPSNIYWHSPDLDLVHKMIAREFAECEKGEIVRIISGEGNTRIWNNELVKGSIILALKKGVKVKCVAGPALNVEGGYNFLLEQALNLDIPLELYVAPRREITHYRIFGERRLWLEKYHEPLVPQESRLGRYVLSGPNNSMGIFIIQKYIKDFEAAVEVSNLKQVKNREDFVLLENETLDKLTRQAKERKEYFDDYDQKKLETVLMDNFK